MSTLGDDVFPHTVDSCHGVNSVTQVTSDSTISTSGLQATISTTDGNLVGNHNIDFSIVIGSNGAPKTTSISYEITPACKYTRIETNH